MELVLTRPKHDSLEIKAVIESQTNYKCIIEPLLEVQILNKNISFDDSNYYLITSVNSVRALKENTQQRNLKLITVGTSSLLEAKKSGFENVVSAVDKNSELFGEEAILNYIKTTLNKNDKLVHISANITKGGLKTGLKELGYFYEQIILYKTKKLEMSKGTKEIIATGKPLAYSFFSPRTAAIFVTQILDNKLTDKLNNSFAFCFSQNVVKGLNGVSFKHVFTPKKVEIKSFIELLKNGAE